MQQDTENPEGAPATVPVEIVSRWDSTRVLFRAEVNASIPPIGRIKAALEIGVKARANLARANLADANLADAYLARAYLARANLADANLADANLADAYLADANLADANLADANLADANLARANLARANLAGAYLADANLAGANLAGANLAGALWRDGAKLNRAPVKECTRSDGYLFRLLDCDVGWRVAAGCRFFTMEEAWRHWGHGERAGTDFGGESEDILIMFEHHIERLEKRA